MNEEVRHKRPSLPLWKPFLVGVGAPLLAHLLRSWLPEAIASGIGFFVAFVVFYQTPPFVERRPALSKTLLWSAAAGVIVFLLTSTTDDI